MYVDENNVAHFTVEELKNDAEGLAAKAREELQDAWDLGKEVAAKVGPALEVAATWTARIIACEQALRRMGAL